MESWERGWAVWREGGWGHRDLKEVRGGVRVTCRGRGLQAEETASVKTRKELWLCV